MTDPVEADPTARVDLLAGKTRDQIDQAVAAGRPVTVTVRADGIADPTDVSVPLNAVVADQKLTGLAALAADGQIEVLEVQTSNQGDEDR
jgi:hypothetical protein